MGPDRNTLRHEYMFAVTERPRGRELPAARGHRNGTWGPHRRRRYLSGDRRCALARGAWRMMLLSCDGLTRRVITISSNMSTREARPSRDRIRCVGARVDDSSAVARDEHRNGPLVTASGQLLRAVTWQPAPLPAGGVGNRPRWTTEPAERCSHRPIRRYRSIRPPCSSDPRSAWCSRRWASS